MASASAASFPGGASAEGSGFERSFDLALRESGALTDGIGGLDGEAPCLEAACVEEITAKAEARWPGDTPSVSSPPEKEPKTLWIAAVTTATVVGSEASSKR